MWLALLNLAFTLRRRARRRGDLSAGLEAKQFGNRRIVRTGDKKLAFELEEKGYDWIVKEEAVTA